MPKSAPSHLPAPWLSPPFPHLRAGHTPGMQVALSPAALGRAQPLPGGSATRFGNSAWPRRSSHPGAFLHPRLSPDLASGENTLEKYRAHCPGRETGLG